MIIEIAGVNTRNKGAELMLVACRQQLLAARPGIRLAVDVSFGGYPDRARHGLWYRPEITRWGRSRLALAVMPSGFAAHLGMVAERDVDAVMDASGFAFGDQLPLDRLTGFARRARRWSERGVPIVLLPQALGPFRKPGYPEAFRELVAASRLVFARDVESLGYAREVVGSDPRLQLAPDFTNLVKPALRVDGATRSRVLVVPNQRMIEMNPSDAAAEAYVRSLASLVGTARRLGAEPVLLAHGRDDLPLLERIASQCAERPRTLVGDDPVELKRMIGECGVLVGSRFHALVSALSQGVPAIGTSWSHKYQRLFEEYAIPELLVPDNAHADVEGLLGRVWKDRARHAEGIAEKAAELEARSHSMWSEVLRQIGIGQPHEGGR